MVDISTSYKQVSHKAPKLVLYSDASKTGWGTFNESDRTESMPVKSTVILQRYCKLSYASVYGQYNQLRIYQ